MLFNSCCCTGPSCTFVGPLAFSSGAVTDNFTVSAGSWAISGGTLNATSSNATLAALTSNPNGDPYMKIVADVTISTSGDTARFYLAGTSWCVEVKFGTGSYIRILSGSTEVARCTTSISTGTHTVCVSIKNNSGVVTIHGNVLVSTGPDVWKTVANSASGATGAAWGLGTGTRTGTVSFDNVAASIVCDSCGDCTIGDCGANCCTGTLDSSVEFEVDLGAGGWTNNLIGSCTSVAGVYTLTYSGNYIYHAAGLEAYICPFSICDHTIDLNIILSLSGCRWTVFVNLGPNSCDGSGAPTDCRANAVYQSSSDFTDCLAGPFTLTKTDDSPAQVCGGSLPSSITLTRTL